MKVGMRSVSQFPASVKRRQRGLALADMALWVVVGAAVVAGAMMTYNYLKGSVGAGEMGEKTALMVSDIQKNWKSAGTFASVSPAEVNKLSLIRNPLKFDGTNLLDGWGNTMALTGGAASFSLTIGGATVPMQQDDCATVVHRLAPMAAAIRVGADAAAAAGAITGGNVYKTGAVVTQAGLTDGCSAANPIIAAQFRP